MGPYRIAIWWTRVEQGSSERMGGLVVLKRRKKRGRNLSRIEEKKRKENEHHVLTLNVSSDW